MTRWAEAERPGREAFWRSHLAAWSRSALNQREYCEAQGLSLKQFGNWRAKFRHETPLSSELLYRRGSGLSHMTNLASHMTNGPEEEAKPVAGRRSFSATDKQRIVEEASQPGVSASQVARRYRIALRVLFRWKEQLRPAPVPAPAAPEFATVEVGDRLDAVGLPTASSPSPPMIVERPTAGIEVELIGGRRVRFERDADPETVRRLVALLEGGAP